MDDTAITGGAAARVAVPWHFWAVGVVSLIWNLFGGYDYWMSRTRNVEYLQQATGNAEVFLKWMDGMSLFNQLAWGIGVWGSVLGSVLLLLRSRHAVGAMLVSLVAAAVSFGIECAAGIPAAMDTPALKVMILVVLGTVLLMWWYAKRAAAKGWLS